MGSYGHLRIADSVIWESKNKIDYYCTVLFTPGDKDFVLSPPDDPYTPIEHVFRISVQEAIERLEILGITYEAAKQAFEVGRESIYEGRWQHHVAARHFLNLNSSDEEDKEYFLSVCDEAEWEFCQNYTLEKWVLKILNGERNYLSDPELLLKQLPIEEDFNSFFLGFPHSEERYAFRILLEGFDPDDEVVLDCTELVTSGWMGIYDELLDVEPLITILTEGPTDIDILQPSLSILYPHLEDYFRFMDFRSLNIEANASALVKLVKAFVGSGIRQQIVAIFDYDAAASDALRALQIDKLPDTIKVVQLPELPLAKHYPTVGPQGIHFADVNGCACSIELYLGEDILKNEKGELTPVRWGAYINGVKRYQGEIENKKRLQQSYLDNILKVEHPDDLPEHDWEAMRLVFEKIFAAFK